MSLALLGALVVAVLLASLALTGAMRRYALARRLIDSPNARSSHTVATPRGGGLAIVACTLAGLLVLAAGGSLPPRVAWGLIGAGALVAAIGFADDHRHVAARWRLLAHFAAALWLLHWLGGMPPVAVPGAGQPPGWLVDAAAAAALVWLLNLYNFMDGIDGIASIEAITACLGGALVAALLGRPELAAGPLLLAAAVAGFLVWNFPPARIFMGDVGSGFLGILLGGFAAQAAWVDPALCWAWVVLLGVFVVDATVTLARRLVRGERVYEAHRSHAYQHAARRHGSHLRVTMAVAAINLFWLLPLAALVAAGRIGGPVAVLVAYAPLLVLAARYRAGVDEPR